MSFLNDRDLGYLMRMLLNHAMGKEKEAKALLDKCDSDIVRLIYAENCVCIDENNRQYEEKCERNKQAALKRWEERNERIQTDANGCERIQTDANGCYTKTNTKLSKDNNNIYSSSSSIACAREEIVESKIWEWQKSDLVTKQKIPPLTDVWIEEVQRLVERFVSKKISEAEIKKHYEDFKAQEATEVLQEPYSTWRKHFNNYVRKTLERQNENGTSKANRQHLSRDDLREQRDKEAADLVQELLSNCT